MSLKIIKAGILDTIQDTGRYGYQHLGINPSGAMDRFSAQLANVLLGKETQAPVMEMHFPAACIVFQQPTVICITGADFSPVINEKAIPLNQPVFVNANTLLHFNKVVYGTWCYLSVLSGFKINKWLNSFSTNIKAAAGGFKGRALQKDDVIEYEKQFTFSTLPVHKPFVLLPWKTIPNQIENGNEVECIFGAEWHCLTSEARDIFQTDNFYLTADADRMGYRLSGCVLTVNDQSPLVSSAVNFGTLQLLPNGQLIVLMADHQTTGGYPKIAHVISAHLPLMAQKKPNDTIKFSFTELKVAEEKLVQQQKYLQNLQLVCKFNMDNWLK